MPGLRIEVGAVVGPDVLPVGLLTLAFGVVVGSLVDMVLGEVDVDLAGVVVDPVDDPAGSVRFLPKIQKPVSTTM